MRFKKILISFLFFGLLITFLYKASFFVHADQAQDLQNQINEYQQKLTLLTAQSNTLSNQIAQFDTQIKLTTLQIAQTEDQINLLGGRIDQLESSLNALSNAFSSRAVETYKMARVNQPILMLISSSDLADMVSRFHYLQLIQESDRDLLQRLQSAQTSYIDQKTEQETLKKQLDTQKTNLNNQKAAKAQLLAATKNDEKKYQQLLAQARAEYEAIQGILAGKGEETQVGHVDANQKIATMIQGPSCNSGGEHLHFMVAQNGVTSNPFNYLKSGIDYDNCSGPGACSAADPFNPSGSWDWPISPRIKFYQGYGVTWAVQNTWVKSIYSSHNGIDIDSESSLDVKAVKSGTLYRGSFGGSGGCRLRYDRIHTDDGGLDTYYLHINYVM